MGHIGDEIDVYDIFVVHGHIIRDAFCLVLIIVVYNYIGHAHVICELFKSITSTLLKITFVMSFVH